jgi:nucleotide-binding universal stress UspA family protein
LPIRKILVAVDGSDPSFNASTYAIDLAKRNDAELIALHVIHPIYSQYETALSPRPARLEEVTKKEMEEGKQHVDKVKQKATEKNVSVKTDVISGITSVVKDIVEYAEKEKIDMIVIGSRGMTGFKKLLLGSVASGVVTYSHCPVLVVK